ncbi:MAG: nitroreductase family protein, partial [Promethearchaeota archaeon]
KQRNENPVDPFLRTAPTLIIIHAKSKTQMSMVDAGIAGHQITMTAQVLGIGSVWNGFHAITCNMFKSLRKLSRVPRGHKVLISICLGYPKVKYKRCCSRKPLRIEHF